MHELCAGIIDKDISDVRIAKEEILDTHDIMLSA